MKTRLFLFLIFYFFCSKIWAGSISGNITYSGSFNGSTVVAAFSSTDIFNNSPVNMVTLISPGPYSLNELNDGTYYVVSVISNDLDNLLLTDPYGFYGTVENLTPVIISGNNNVSGINITLVDGTTENPNPFARDIITPDQIIQLPETTINGTNPSLLFDGTSIFLYKHDSPGAPSAKIFEINPESGAVLNTIYLTLESLPNRISWIDQMVYRNGVLWASGGYGDPSGLGYIDGIFMINIYSSNSSSQIPLNSAFEQIQGLACDGTNFYALVDSAGVDGIVKLNPDEKLEMPSKLFIRLDDQCDGLSYGNNFLWIGAEYVNKYDPVSGNMTGMLKIPGKAAELFIDGKFWTYEEHDNTLKVYSQSPSGINPKNKYETPKDFSLSQNYPNPFNPGTTISFSIPSKLFVSLKVFDALGKEISVLVSEELSAGTYEHRWIAQDLPSGVYFYTLQTANFTQSRKLILLK